MRALKCAVTTKKLKRYGVLILLIFLVVALSGCVEDDAGEDEGLDLGEPVDVVTNYVGTEGFGIEGDVQDELEGEGSLYALVTEVTEEQSSGTALKQYAKFAEVTYLDKNGNEVKKYAINGEFVDLSGDEIEQLKAHSLREDQIIPLMELKDGICDCSMLKELTEKDYVYDYSIFPDGKTKENDEFIGNSNKIFGLSDVPELFFGRTGGKDIVIFNQAFLDTTKFGCYEQPTIEEGTKIEDIIWDYEYILKVPEHPEWGNDCFELAPGLYYGICDTWQRQDIIVGTVEKKTCVCVKKKPA